MPQQPASRRRFLRQTALAAGATALMPALVPPSVFGQNSPNSRIGVGFIGTGRQAYHANLLPFLASPETRVVAVCDVDRWRAEQTRKRVDDHYAVTEPGRARGCAVTGDFREVLARADVDAVMISTPDHWHAVMAVAAGRAGKHVALEKPISLSIHQGRAIANAFPPGGKVFRTDTEVRSAKEFRQLRQIVRTGRIGRVTSVVAGVPNEQPPVPAQPEMAAPEGLDYPMWLGPAPAAPYTTHRVHQPEDLRARPGWMLIRDYCDGMICNWGTHLLDIVQWTLGAGETGPVEVRGSGTFHPAGGLSGVLAAFDVRYRYADGITLDYRMAGRPFLRFTGTDGWVEAEWWKGLTASRPAIIADPIEADGLEARQVNEKLDFIDAIRRGRPTLIPAETGHRTNSLCQLGLIAIEMGETLRWDPGVERFVDNPTANQRLERPLREPWKLG
ncbi:MAG: Gfo/Idh/MocA family oxidoreductase [Verrucomicrobiales bacterium]|nr:Gfo/Idh/MocA family oxidoreductase [Verrucomicrobiales bacterium]